VLGRYELLGAIGQGGMATVYLGRHEGQAGFQRLFAVKVLHPYLAQNDEFVSMMLDEARIAARLHHPNVVPIIDEGFEAGFRYVVLEYVEGDSLSALVKASSSRPPQVMVPIFLDVLAGLQAAHTLVGEDGRPLNLVHRDVSPHNVLVGLDGASRITDFGVAHAQARLQSTNPGQRKGKFLYMSPEQISGDPIDGRSDVFSLGAVMWSVLTGKRLFLGATDTTTMTNVLKMPIARPSTVGFRPPVALDAIVMKALERRPENRFASAQEMEEALREVALMSNLLGTRRDVAGWVEATVGEELAARREGLRVAALTRRERLASMADPLEAATTPSNPSNPSSVSNPSNSGVRGPSEPSISGVGRRRSEASMTPGMETLAPANHLSARRPNVPLLLCVTAALGIAAGTLLGYSIAERHPSPPQGQCR
jgi:serine/threonine-protein kinase